MKYILISYFALISIAASAQSDTVAYWFSKQMYERDSARWRTDNPQWQPQQVDVIVDLEGDNIEISFKNFQVKTVLPEIPLNRFNDWVQVYQTVTCEYRLSTPNPYTITEYDYYYYSETAYKVADRMINNGVNPTSVHTTVDGHEFTCCCSPDFIKNDYIKN